jgi:hypothetical protein
VATVGLPPRGRLPPHHITWSSRDHLPVSAPRKHHQPVCQARTTRQATRCSHLARTPCALGNPCASSHDIDAMCQRPTCQQPTCQRLSTSSSGPATDISASNMPAANMAAADVPAADVRCERPVVDCRAATTGRFDQMLRRIASQVKSSRNYRAIRLNAAPDCKSSQAKSQLQSDWTECCAGLQVKSSQVAFTGRFD